MIQPTTTDENMNKRLDEYLCKKYPKIFADRHKPMDQTCMCWGFSHGNGWFHLIDNLCKNIQRHIDNPPYVEQKDIFSRLKRLWNKTMWNWIIYPLVSKLSHEEFLRMYKCFHFDVPYVEGPKIHQVVADQVKEKFGGLRFYTSGGDTYCRGMIDFAESLSYHICEVCGKFDETVVTSGKGWIRSTCSCCIEDKTTYNKALDKKMIDLWKKVREDESKKTSEI